MNLSTILGFLPVIGPIASKAPEFIALFNEVKATFSEDDQAVLQEALEDLHAVNEEGNKRLQAKLEAAKAR